MSDILTRIEQLKRDRNAVILTHYYQDPDIQDVGKLQLEVMEL